MASYNQATGYMYRNILVTRRTLFICVMTVLTITIIAGCTSIQQGNCVTPYYKSIILNDQLEVRKFGSVRINTIEFDKPDVDLHWDTAPIRFICYAIPVLSAIPLSDSTVKNCAGSHLLQEGEVEELLVSEMCKTGMFKEVRSRGGQGDYDVNGRINFTIDRYFHQSGFGIFYGIVLPTVLFPYYTDQYKCEAHFEVISVKDNNLILSKDYRVVADKLQYIFTHYDEYNVLRPGEPNRILGEQIFPVIMRDFINDIKINL